MQKLRINLFGELWKLSRLELTETEYIFLKTRTAELKLPLTEALLDVSFFETSIFAKVFTYEDFKQTTIKGLSNTYKNQIEIWYAGKKIQKLTIAELNNDYLLFPLYNSNTEILKYTSLPGGIYIEQKEIGMVGCYESFIGDFKLDNLDFKILKVEKHENSFDILNEIRYKKQILANRKKVDTLIIQQHCFEI